MSRNVLEMRDKVCFYVCSMLVILNASHTSVPINIYFVLMISSTSSPNWPIAASKPYPVAFQKSCSDYSDKLYQEKSKEAK